MGKTKSTTEEFKVTLAHKKSGRLDVGLGVFIQPKLDGVRCYTRLDEDGNVRMFSRNHKEFMNCEHIKTELNGFFKQHPNVILDGELYNHKYRDNFNKIISLVRKSKPTQADKFQAASSMQYHVYDMFDPNTADAPYSDRLNFLQNTVWNGLRSVKEVDTKVVWTEEGIKRFHAENLHAGYEGSMLRRDEAYQQRRSHGLQKVKDFHDTEFMITDFVEGKGKFTGGLGKFLGYELTTGRAVEVPYQKLKLADRKTLWEDREYYRGKIATMEYFERTPDGAFRFPQFKCLRNYE